jgi:phospholipase C
MTIINDRHATTVTRMEPHNMNAQRFAAAGMAAALSSAVLSGCNGANSGMLPTSPSYGSLETQHMTPQTHALLVSALQKKIKHVFVIFQENHSFDNYFGTFPGAENLGTALAKSHGYTQYDPIGKRNQRRGQVQPRQDG